MVVTELKIQREVGICILQCITDHCQAHENCLAVFAAVLSTTFGDLHSMPSCSTFQTPCEEQSRWNSGLFWGRGVQSCRVRQERDHPAVLRCWEPGPARALIPHSQCEKAIYSHPQKAEMRFQLKERVACDTWLFRHWFLGYFPPLSLLPPP